MSSMSVEEERTTAGIYGPFRIGLGCFQDGEAVGGRHFEVRNDEGRVRELGTVGVLSFPIM